MAFTKSDLFAVTCLMFLRWIQRETDIRLQYRKLDFFRKIITSIGESTSGGEGGSGGEGEGGGFIAKVIMETKMKLASVEEFAKKFPTIDREVADMFSNDLRLVRRGDLVEIPEMMIIFRECIPAILSFLELITNDSYGFIHQTTMESRVKAGDVIHPTTMCLLGLLDKSRDYHTLRQLKIYVSATSKITIKDALNVLEKERSRLNDDLRRSGKGSYGTPILDEIITSFSIKTDGETNNHSYKNQYVNALASLVLGTAGIS